MALDDVTLECPRPKAIQINTAKIYNSQNHIYGENIKLKLSPWNFHQKYDFCNTQISKELAKR